MSRGGGGKTPGYESNNQWEKILFVEEQKRNIGGKELFINNCWTIMKVQRKYYFNKGK